MLAQVVSCCVYNITKIIQDDNIPYMFDYYVYPIVHLLLLNSSMAFETLI